MSNIIHEFLSSLVGISQMSEVHWEFPKNVCDDFPKLKLILWQYILRFLFRNKSIHCNNILMITTTQNGVKQTRKGRMVAS